MLTSASWLAVALLVVAAVLAHHVSGLGLFGPVPDPYTLQRVQTVVVGEDLLQWRQGPINMSSSGDYPDIGQTGASLTTFQRLSGLVYSGFFTFSGAACATYSLHSEAQTLDFGLLIVQDNIWQTAALQDPDFDLLLDAAPGLVPNSSLRAGSSQTIGLAPNETYQLILDNDGNETVDLYFSFATYDADSAECEGTYPPGLIEGSTGQEYPPGLVDGQVLRDYQAIKGGGQASAQTANVTAEVQYLVQNASCLTYNMWLPGVAQDELSKYSIALYTTGQLADAIYALDAGQLWNYSSCSGLQCQATASTWVTWFNLQPSHELWVVTSYDWSVSTANNPRIHLLVQAFPVEQCAALQAALGPDAPPPSTGTVSSQGSPAASGSSKSSTGAIAGGVVGGVCGAALIAALALYLWRRHRAQESSSNSNRLPLARQRTGTSSPETSQVQNRDGGQSPGQGNTVPKTESLPNGLYPFPLTGQAPGSSISTNQSMGSFMSGASVDNPWSIDPAAISICENADGTLVKLGEGGFGCVYKALQDDVRHVAVKVSRSSSESRLAETQAFWEEVARLAECRDKNVLQFYGVARHGEEVMLVTEFCERGDLYHALAAVRHDYCDSIYAWHHRGMHIACDIARGLHAIHMRKILHFDIKSPNILLTLNYDAKIADVGLAHPLFSKTHISEMSHTRGTWSWQAPEVLLGRQTSFSADVWSFGVILHELMTGEKPQRGRLRAVRVPEEASAEAVRLMDACLEEEPAQRPTAKQIIGWLQSIIASHSQQQQPQQ